MWYLQTLPLNLDLGLSEIRSHPDNLRDRRAGGRGKGTPVAQQIADSEEGRSSGPIRVEGGREGF